MKIIVGLGNPGSRYKNTRHNAGFLAIDHLIHKWNALGPSTQLQCTVYRCTLEFSEENVQKKESLFLIKPMTPMNLSGQCLVPFFHFYQCSEEDLIIIHDDLDLPAFSLRLKTGGGTGGHNGLKSIDASFGSIKKKYHKIRIGIGHPRSKAQTKTMAVSDYVLQRFTPKELQELEPTLEEVTHATKQIISGKIKEAMNQYHCKKKKPTPHQTN